MALLDLDSERFSEAGMLAGGNLRSLDALHISSALDAGCDLVLAYDQRVIQAASTVGLDCESPR